MQPVKTWTVFGHVCRGSIQMTLPDIVKILKGGKEWDCQIRVEHGHREVKAGFVEVHSIYIIQSCNHGDK